MQRPPNTATTRGGAGVTVQKSCRWSWLLQDKPRSYAALPYCRTCDAHDSHILFAPTIKVYNVVACCSLARVAKCVRCISDHAIQHWKLTPNAAAWFLLTWLSQIYHIFLQNCFVIHSTLYSASLMIYVPCDDTLLEMNCAKGKNGHGTFSAEWSSITLLLHTGAAQMTK